METDNGVRGLGFEYRARKNGEVEILRFDKRIAVLRGSEAEDFLAAAEESTEEEIQLELARVTGNYKRGNERLASGHPRNR
jgi:hypothetical protein